MHNKYIKYFFDLTKQNIVNESLYNYDRFPRYAWFLGLTVVFFIVTAVLYIFNFEKLLVNKVEKTPVLIISNDAKLISVIPSLYISATYQMLQKISLLKTDSVFDFKEKDDSFLSHPVIDSVLVIPKSFG